MQSSEHSEAHAASHVDPRPEIFVPQTLLPEQHADRCGSRSADTPYKRLLMAVLMDAILQLLSRNARDAIEAESWILNGRPTDSPFSFTNICDVLGIESSYFVRGLLAWRDRPTDTMRRAPLPQVRAARSHVVAARARSRPAIAGRARAITKPLPR